MDFAEAETTLNTDLLSEVPPACWTWSVQSSEPGTTYMNTERVHDRIEHRVTTGEQVNPGWHPERRPWRSR